MKIFFTGDTKNTDILNTFFLNPVKNLKISEFHEFNHFPEKVSHPVLKVFFKYFKHSSFIAITNVTIGLGSLHKK